jgi:hypothetical protein
MAVGAVVARILTQYSDKGSKAAQKDISKLGKNIDVFAKKSARAFGIAALASAAALAKISKDAIMAASDLSQQFGALDAVFGSNSEQLKTFSKSMVDYGLSTADAARYAALLGTQLKGLGLEEQDAIDRTKKLQILAADLAATYGGTTADAVAALSSTFKGEYNPIEKYGVAIRKSDITARLAAKGLAKLKGDALKAAEAQEAYALILAKTTAAQGQSRREYNTFAAQLQRVNATFENMKASLGAALLPVMEKFADVLITKLLPRIQAFVDANKDKLAAAFAVAAEMAFKLLTVAIAFSDWCVNNMGVVKGMAALIAGMFVVGRIAAFVTAIGTITTAMALLRTTTIGAAVATAFATSGVSIALGAAALATVGLGIYTVNGMVGENAKGSGTSATTSKKGISPRGNTKNRDFSVTPYSPVTNALDKFTTSLEDATKATKDKLINEAAAKKNLERQKMLSKTPTILTGSGRLSMTSSGSNVIVNVAGSVTTQQDLVTSIVNGIERTTRRSFGSVGAFDRVAIA